MEFYVRLKKFERDIFVRLIAAAAGGRIIYSEQSILDCFFPFHCI